MIGLKYRKSYVLYFDPFFVWLCVIRLFNHGYWCPKSVCSSPRIEKRTYRRNRSFCGLSDALLITLGVSGVGAFLSKIPQLSKIFTLAGFLFLSYYSIMALRRAMKPEDSLNLSKGHSVSLAKALFTVAAFTWLNPHVYIDTVLLMGTAASAQPYSLRPIFGIGASAASFVWFFALGYAARFLQPIFQHPRSWQRLDILTGSVMLFLAFLLLWQGILHPFLSL